MKTQARIIFSIVSLVIISVFGLFLSPSSTGHAAEPAAGPQIEGPGTTIYLPLVHKPLPAPTATTALGFELTNNKILSYAEELAPFHLDFIRGNLGNVTDPLAAPYQVYLAGGWAETDAKMLPNIDGWRAIGAEPLFVFMPGFACSPPSNAQLDGFADFVAAAVERYDLKYFEVWNEPDAKSGAPSLYGCLGKDHVDKLIYLLDRIRPQLDAGRQMGVSFAMGSEESLEMVEDVAPHVDFVGIHHYGIWVAGQVLESDWPGSLTAKYNLTKAAANVPVWITELNLRSPNDECGASHQLAAQTYIEEALELGAPMTSILVYKSYPDWQCTGIRDTLLGQMLLQDRVNMAP